MKHRFLFLLFMIIFSANIYAEEEHVVGTLNKVDLISANLFNEDGHNFGEKYFVLNRNDQPMRISIHLIESENAVDHLVKYTIIINEHDRVEVGHILQDKVSAKADWKYEWQVENDRSLTG